MFAQILTSSLIIVLLVAIFATLLKIFLSIKRTTPRDFPYQRDMFLFSPTERSFFSALEQAVAGEYRILAKVRLADVIGVKPELSGIARRMAESRIKGRHIDFVAYHPLTFEVAFAVALDDRGIAHSQWQPRDEFVDNALRSAGIPIIHFNVHRTYKVREIRNALSWMSSMTTGRQLDWEQLN
ncbi:MAG: DUF2726 domain-containing protein [Syntrophaceae bacterium]|nr:DUF2726 domain-containing protein [Syntrophaceae bacterium]